jgi:phytanoyl-CoA hydroxylase
MRRAAAVHPQMTDAEVLRKYLAIHFPHKLSPLIARSLSHPGIVEILRRIISPNVKCMQSMLFVKGPGKPGQSWHQDEYYIPTRDRSLGAAWIAIDDATIENGCLWIIPGSHQSIGYLRDP